MVTIKEAVVCNRAIYVTYIQVQDSRRMFLLLSPTAIYRKAFCRPGRDSWLLHTAYPDEFCAGWGLRVGLKIPTRRLYSSSFLWLIFRILQGNPKKELLWSL